MMDPTDLEHCKDAIRQGSLSFHAASKVLPAHVRDPALALYAFCRLADDAVDLHSEKAAAVLRLKDRLERVYDGRPENAPADRAFAAVVDQFEMPRELPEALLEGLAWDAMDRRYDTLSDLFDYCARVASAVGAMMAVLMGVRDRNALARACDLGVAMQLTNIARDVGEDARERRLYLPLEWMDDAGIEADTFFNDPIPSTEIRGMVHRLLSEANRLYRRSEAGIAVLPVSCRTGIFAARFIYAAIGAEITRAGHDSVSLRAHTSSAQKLRWLSLSALRAGSTLVTPQSAILFAPALPEVQFLVDATARGAQSSNQWGEGRAGELIGLFAALKAHDVRQRGLDTGSI